MRRNRLQPLAALVAGAFLVLAFSPFGWWPLAVLSPAVLILLCRDASGRRAFWLGYLFGFGLFLAGVPWVYVSVHTFGHAGAPGAALVTGGFAAVLALFPACAALLAARFNGPALLAWPAAWVLLEWLRGWFLTGFPWLQLGYSQTDTWLGGWLPVAGVLGAGLALMVCAAGIAELVRPGMARRTALAGLIAAIWAAGFGLGRVAWTEPEGEPVDVALLQGNFSQDVKWSESWLRAQLDWYAQRTRDHLDADLVVWPETALPTFYQQLEVPYFSSLAAEADNHDAGILAGVLYGDYDDAFNAVIGLGAASGVYKKIHLVPLGEYFPLKSLVRFLLPGLDIPMNDLGAGARDQAPIRLDGRSVAVSICYEDAYGDITRRLLPRAGLLLNVSNDAWFGDTAAPHQHLQIARALALQAGRPLLRAANTGISAIIDHRGRVVQELDQFRQGVVTGTVTPRAGATPWARAGDWPALALILILGLMAAATRR